MITGVKNEDVLDAISASEAASEQCMVASVDTMPTHQERDDSPGLVLPTRLRANVTASKKAPPEVVRAFDARKQRIERELAMNTVPNSSTLDVRSGSEASVAKKNKKSKFDANMREEQASYIGLACEDSN